MDIKELGKNNNIAILQKFGENLVAYIQNFDIKNKKPMMDRLELGPADYIAKSV